MLSVEFYVIEFIFMSYIKKIQLFSFDLFYKLFKQNFKDVHFSTFFYIKISPTGKQICKKILLRFLFKIALLDIIMFLINLLREDDFFHYMYFSCKKQFKQNTQLSFLVWKL